jgi:spore coat protein U-like protein
MPLTPSSLARAVRAAFLCLLGLLGLVAAGNASAQACAVAATAVQVGAYNPLSATPLDANGTVTVTCGQNAVALVLGYTVMLSTGQSGSYATRKMANGSKYLNYQLYTNVGRNFPWGDGTSSTSFNGALLTLSLFGPVSASYTVYGRIPALQNNITPGNYSDVITVTVSY